MKDGRRSQKQKDKSAVSMPGLCSVVYLHTWLLLWKCKGESDGWKEKEMKEVKQSHGQLEKCLFCQW